MEPPRIYRVNDTDQPDREIRQGTLKLLIAFAATALLVIDVYSQTSQDFRKIWAPEFGFFTNFIYVVDFILFWVAATNFLRAWWFFFPHPAPKKS